MPKAQKKHVGQHVKKAALTKKKAPYFWRTGSRHLLLTLLALLAVLLLAFFLLPKKAMLPAPSDSALTARQLEKLDKIDLPFMANNGQTSPSVGFFSQLRNGTFFIGHDASLTYKWSLGKAADLKKSLLDARQKPINQSGQVNQSFVLKEFFHTTQPITASTITSEDPGTASVNYFLGEKEKQWLKDQPTYGGVALNDIFQGIDVILNNHGGNIKKTFYVKAQADVSQIAMGLEGIKGLTIAADGQLALDTDVGIFHFTKPIAYQEIEGSQKPVDISYRIIDQYTYGFQAGEYDHDKLLIIDPLLVSTYLGGGKDGEYLRGDLGGNNNMVIANGSLYVTAYTWSDNFPTTAGAYQEDINANSDIIISKIDLDLGTLEASTYLGGSGEDVYSVMAVDTTGNLFVAGTTYSTDFPGVTGGYQTALAGGGDAFIAKMNGNLNTLLAASYIGGVNDEALNGLAYDPTGFVYAAIDASTGFPTTPIAAATGYDTSFYAPTGMGDINIAVVRLNSDLSNAYYTMTFIDGVSNEGALARDADGKIFLVAGTLNTDFTPPFVAKRANGFVPSYQESLGGNYDTIVARFSADLTNLEASTFLGGPNLENNSRDNIVIHGSGASEQVFVIGDTVRANDSFNAGMKGALNNNSHTLDTNPDPAEKIMTFGPLSSGSGADLYIMRFNRDLQTAAATIIGGSGNDYNPYMTLNTEGDVYLTGDTGSTDFPTTPGAFMTTGGIDSYDPVAAKISNDLTQLQGATYLGGSDDDYSGHIIIDETNGYDIAFINGETYSDDIPATANGFQPAYAGSVDLYLSAFTCAFANVCPAENLQATAGNGEVDLTWTLTPGNVLAINDYEIHYSIDGFAADDQIFVDAVSTLTSTTVTGLANGTDYAFQVYAIDANDETSPGSNIATATPVGTVAPAAIDDLFAVPGDAEATLSWSAPEDYGNPITSHVIHYSNDGFASDDHLCVASSCTDATPGATVPGLTNATEYSFRVYAVNAYGTSAVSNTATATPVANAVLGAVEVHLADVKAYLVSAPGTYNLATTGLSDNTNGAEDINSFNSPRSDNFTGITPSLPRAVRYSYFSDGETIENDGLSVNLEDMSGATSVTLPDDALTAALPLGFTTILYGIPVDTIKISSNGFIYANHTTVTATNSGCCGGQDLSRLMGTGLVGSDLIIAGDWTDLYPPGKGTIKYKTIGVTPNRVFVVDFSDVSPCCDATGGNSFQIKFFETAPTTPAPQVTSVSPVSGLTTGGENVVISGSGFDSSATVLFDDQPATNVVVVNAFTITATTPAHAAGPVNVTVTNSDFQSGSLLNAYLYAAALSPNLNYCEGYSELYGDERYFNLALDSEGQAWWWGQFSDYTPLSLVPVRISALDNAIDISVSEQDADSKYALLPDQTVWAWGLNNYGQLGNGNNVYQNNPVQVSGLTGVTAIVSGNDFATALKSDGTVWAWGYNEDERLHDGTVINRNVPVPVLGLSGIEEIYGAGVITYALKDDGSYWRWGPSDFTELVPPAGKNIVSIKANAANAMILLDDGTIWGDPSVGPTAVDIFPGFDTNFAERDDGNLFGWGNNCNGQLGIGDYDCELGDLPTQVSVISDVKDMFLSGDSYSMALLDDLTLWGFGSSAFGNPAPESTVPQPLFALDNVKKVLPGSYGANVLKEDGTIWSWGNSEQTYSSGMDYPEDYAYGFDLGNGTYAGSNTPVQTNSPCSNISPNHGPLIGGTEVTLTGIGFQSGATVTFGGVPGTGIIVNSDTEITVTTPAHAIGAVDVVVTNPDSQTTTASEGFRYTALPPEITLVNPASGSSASFTPVTITGTNFQTGATVTFGGTLASNVTVQNSTTIVTSAPPHAPGLVDVAVTNPDDVTTTQEDAFTYTGTSDIPITTLQDSDQNNPSIVTTSDGDYLMAWVDLRDAATQGTEVYAQKIDGVTGDIIWTTHLNGRQISDQSAYQPYSMYYPQVAADQSGGAFIAWDSNFGGWEDVDIVVDHIDGDGNNYANWEELGVPGITITPNPTFPYAGMSPQLLSDGLGGIYVGWFQRTNNTWPMLYDVQVTHLDGVTAAVIGNWPQTINNENVDQYPQIVEGESGGVIVANFGSGSEQMHIQQYDAAGNTAGLFNGQITSNSFLNGTNYKVVSDGDGGVKIAYIHDTAFNNGISVFHIDKNGDYIWDDTLVEPGQAGKSVNSINASNTAAGEFYVIYNLYDNVAKTTSINARHVSPAGVISPIIPISTGNASLADRYSHFRDLALDSFGGIVLTYLQDLGTDTLVAVSQLNTHDDVETSFSGVGGIDPDFSTIAMNGTSGAIAWSSNSVASAGSYEIYAHLISVSEPINPPTITDVTPDWGPLAGGTSITITGTYFEDGATTVTIGGSLSCQLVTVISPTSLTCTTPAGDTAGLKSIAVTTSQGTATLHDAFSYTAPGIAINSVAPAVGVLSGGTTVVIEGINFEAAPPVVSFGAEVCKNVVVTSNTTLTCYTPAGPGLESVDVEVSNTGGSDVLTDGFTYQSGIGEAQWPSVNNPSPTILHTNSQETRGARTSDGSYLVAFYSSPIVVQKFNTAGSPLWNSGTPTTLPDGQGRLFETVADSAGGGYVLYYGPKAGGTYVRVSRLSSSGAILWTRGPFEGNGYYDRSPRLINDGSDGVYVTWWTDDGSGATTQITHLGPDGDVCDIASCGVDWNSAGSGTYRQVSMPTVNTTVQLNPRLTLSSAGSVLVTDNTDTGLMTVKLNPDGSNAWGPPGTNVLITDPDGQNIFMAEPDGSNGIFLSYWSVGATDYALKIARIASGGTFVFGNSSGGLTRKLVPMATSNPDGISSASDADGNFYLAWNEVSPESDLYVQKYDGSGNEEWTIGGELMGTLADGVEDFTESNNQNNLPHYLVSDGMGGVIVGIIRDLSIINVPMALGQRVAADGSHDWLAGYRVSGSPATSENEKLDLLADGHGGAIFAWYTWDDFTEIEQIEAQYVKSGLLSTPTVTAVYPPSGPAGGGQNVMITGNYFLPGTTVTFGGVPATNVTLLTTNTLTATTPAHAQGDVNVIATTTEGTGTLTNGYHYNANAPTITEIAPSEGSIMGGSLVVITGTNFVAGATVTFGGTNAQNTTVVSSTEIVTTTPAHSIGVVDVTVINPDLQQVTSYESYDYLAAVPPSLHHCVDYSAFGLGPNYSTLATLANDDTVWGWGGNGSYELGNGTINNSSTPVQAIGFAGNVTKYSFGSNYVLALLDDGTVWAWGYNDYGQVGNGTYNAATTPVQVNNLTDIIDIQSGLYHNIALKNDGTVWTWGYNYYGQLGNGNTSPRNYPAAVSGITTATGIATTTYSTSVVLSTGTVWSFGYNYYSQLGNNSTTQSTVPVQAIGLTGVTAIATGDYHVLARKNDGTLWAWGRNANGQIGNSSTGTRVYVPTQVRGLYGSGFLANVTQVAAGPSNSFAIDSSGALTAWGYGTSGLLGIGYSVTSSTYPIYVSGMYSGVVSVDTASDHNMALMEDGTVWAWGNGDYGQLGNAVTADQYSPVQVQGLAGADSIQATALFSAARRMDGTLWLWGYNGNGSLGNNSWTNSSIPVQPASVCSVGLNPALGQQAGGTVLTITGANFDPGVSINIGGNAAGVVFVDSHTLTVTTPTSSVFGTVDVVAINPDGMSDTLVDGFTYTTIEPYITTITPNTGRSVGGEVVLLTGDNYIAGATTVSFNGNLCSNVTVLTPQTLTCTTPASTPALTEGLVDVIITTVNGTMTLEDGYTYTTSTPSIATISPNLGPTAGGDLVTITGQNLINSNLEIQFGLSSTDLCQNVTYAPDGNSLTCNVPAHAVGLVNVQVTTDYGTDTLTNGYEYITALAPNINACSAFVEVASGSGYGATETLVRHSIALADNGTVWTWGDNSAGQLGVPYIVLRSASPVQVPALSGITHVYAGDMANYALRYDGTVWAWGRNYYGQLGIGSNSNSNVPVRIQSLSHITALSVEANHVLALKSDGTVWAWGQNFYGELGIGDVDGDPENSNYPQQVVGLTGVQSVHMGQYHAFAIKNDGTLWAWGNNNYGQLGANDGGDSSVPVLVEDLTGVTDIKLGEEFTMALRNDDTVWTWGRGFYGQLGNGDSGAGAIQYYPDQVFDNTKAIEVGNVYAHAIRNDGTVWSWGANNYGQLGNGTFDQQTYPTQALKLSGMEAIDTSWYGFTLAIKDDGTVWAWGANESGTVGDGTQINRSTPAQVGGPLTNITAMTAVADYALVISGDGPIWVWGRNNDGNLGNGTFITTSTPLQAQAITCSAITPNHGSFLGGTEVYITGANFLSGATVTFDGVPATAVQVISPTEIECVTPEHVAEAVDVTVTNPDLQSGTRTDGYTYEDQPLATLIVPNSGPSAGGTSVTITGGNFVPGTSVTFGGLPGTSTTVVDADTLTTTTPAHPLGPVTVTITTPFGVISVVDGFTYTVTAGSPGEWILAGTPIDDRPTPASPDQDYPFTITASDGNFIVAWVRELADKDPDIAVQKLTRADGSTLWPDDGGGSGGMRITDLGVDTYEQEISTTSPSPLVADNNGGAYMIWIEYNDPVGSGSNLMMQHIGSDGTLLYGAATPHNLSNNAAGIRVLDHSIIEDGTGGVYVAWSDEDADENRHTHMKRITGTGQEYTVQSSVAFPTDAVQPRLALDSNGNAYVAYNVWGMSAQTVYVRKVLSDCSLPSLGQDWFSPKVIPFTATESTNQYFITTDTADNVIFVYVSADSGTQRIAALRIAASGEELEWYASGTGPLILGTIAAGDSAEKLQINPDGNDGVIALWDQYNSGDIFMQKVDATGSLIWGAEAKEVSNGVGLSNRLGGLNSLTSDGFGGAIIAYYSNELVGHNHGLIAGLINQILAHAASDDGLVAIHLQKISSEGNFLWPIAAPAAIGFTDFSSITSGYDYSPVITGDGLGGAAVFWSGLNGTGLEDLYGQYYKETTVPTITSISPNYGPTAGGTSVTIRGTNFDSPGIIIWLDGDQQCGNMVIANATTITCETPAHAAGPVDVEVVGAYGMDTLAGGYTYGDEIICTGDGINTFCGQQFVGACAMPTTTFTAAPNDIAFGEDGARFITSSNDTAYAPTVNGAYFDESVPDDFSDEIDTLTITSNTEFSCGRLEAGVTLAVEATPFQNEFAQDLVTYGADGQPGGIGENADFYGMLSVITSAEATCAGGCTPASNTVESNNEIKAGQNNFFATSSPIDGSLSTNFEDVSVLIDNANEPNTVILYQSSHGFNGPLTIPGLDFTLALPGNIAHPGSYSSTITYTVS